MVVRLFPLLAYLAAAAYLMIWLICQIRVFYQSVRAWRLQQRMAGKVLSLKTWNKVGESHYVLNYMAGALFGCLVAYGLIQIFIKEWLLVVLVVLALLSEEFRIGQDETILLEVIVFFDRLAAHLGNDQDLYGTLAKVLQELPAGDVLKGVREAVLRRRSGDCFENSLKAMCGLDPFLDEFVLTLQLSGWQNGLALPLILNRLLARAGRRWDRASKFLLLKDKSRKYAQLGRGALISGLCVILTNSLTAVVDFMPGRNVFVWAGLALLGLGLLLYLLLKSHWLRLSLAVSLFLIALMSYANSLVIPIPSWIQVETISHRSGSVSDSGVVTTQVMTVREMQIAAFQLLPTFRDPPIQAIANPTSTPAPTILPTMTVTPFVNLFTPSIPEVLDPCCLRSRQPR